jgi:hypothetical protein
MSNIVVIGESCTDVFVYCNAVRLAPDVPVPVLNIVNQTRNLGMAANVFNNIVNHIDDCKLITNSNYEKITKTRYVHSESNHSFFRVDSEDSIQRIDLSLIDYDCEIIIISDYNKGYLHRDDIETICSNHPKVFLDTKKNLGQWASNAAYIKINDFEYQNSKRFLSDKLDKKIIHTMGSQGCEFNGVRYPVDRVEVKDSSGAGDTFMASLVLKYYKTNDIIKSIKFANKCASEIVKHRGVTTI